jgi:hypothetical protein
VHGGGSFADVDLFEDDHRLPLHSSGSRASDRTSPRSPIRNDGSRRQHHSGSGGDDYTRLPPASDALYKPKAKKQSHRNKQLPPSRGTEKDIGIAPYEHQYGSRFGQEDYDDNVSVRSGGGRSSGRRKQDMGRGGRGGGYDNEFDRDPYDDYKQFDNDDDDVRSVRSANPFADGGGGGGDDRSESRRSSRNTADRHRRRDEGRGGGGGGYDDTSSRRSGFDEDRNVFDDERSYRSGRSGRSGRGGGGGGGGGGRGGVDNYYEDADPEMDRRSRSSPRKTFNNGFKEFGGGSGGNEEASLLGGTSSGDRILLSDGGQGRPCVYLILALILILTGIGGGQYFMSSDCVKNAMVMDEWSNTSGYNLTQFIGLVLQTFLIPFGFCLFFIFVSQSTNHPAWSHKRKSVQIVILIIMLLYYQAHMHLSQNVPVPLPPTHTHFPTHSPTQLQR